MLNKLNTVWLVSQNTYSPKMNAGTRHYGMGKVLHKNGVQLIIFTSSFNHKKLEETVKYKFFSLYKIEHIDGVQFVWIRCLSYFRNDGFRRLLSMLLFSISVVLVSFFSKKFKKPEAIIGSTPTLIPAFFTSLIASIKRLPFLLEVRDLWPETIVQLDPSKKNNPLIKVFYWMETYCYKKAVRIAGLLPGIPNYLNNIEPGLSNKFFWLPNGVERDQLSNKPILNSNVENLVYAGALSKGNSVITILEAADLLKDKNLKFHLYGSGDEKQQLLAYKEQNNLENVFFHEPLPKNQIFNVLESADILLGSMKKSNLYQYGISQNKIYDYMGAGKPIVFGSEAYNDPVSEANAGFTFLPEDPKEMANAIMKVVNMDLSERLKMGNNGKFFLKKGHSFDVLGNRLLGVLKEIS